MRSIAACLALLLLSSATLARELTFEQRVAAQAAIERTYHAHQIGATKSVEEAVPRAVLEQKVRAYLLRSAKLNVTAEMLERELSRMAEGTQMPDRLRELFEALGNDTFLIQECLARPALVERLSGDVARPANTSAAFDPAAVPAVASSSVPVPRLPRSKTDFSPSSCAANDTWDNRRLGTATEARSEHTAVWTGSLMIVWGGKDQVGFPASGHRYDPATDTWSPTSMVNTPRARIGHTAVWTGSVMIVHGGYDTLDNGGAHYWGDGAKYDPVADTWQPIAPAFGGMPRAFHTAVWTGSRMIVWGGSPAAGVLTETGAVYDPVTDTWAPISAGNPPSPRYRHTAVWTGSKMIVWGGHTNAGTDSTPVPTGAVYDPVANTWTATALDGVPSARGYHVAVWTGFEMVIWGGGIPPTNSGGRYNPGSNTWIPMNVAGAPTGRRLASAVWTGSRMFVFGGYDSNMISPLNTGGLYDPQANTWTTTSTTNAPSPRESHTAVWTGSEAIIWGGGNPNLHVKTGGRFDPGANSWVPTASDATPRARLDARAVWTGTHMIVWGGGVVTNWNTVAVAALQSGGRYDPALDLWTPTNLTGAPSPRIYHRAVWTGDRMIVWGGASNNSGSVLSTGAIYDPIQDSWVATPAGPSARSSHVALWTGNRMVIWGGSDGSNPLATGSRFDPFTNTWSATTTVGAPSERAVIDGAFWTGTRVLIWGGDEFQPHTGGLYDPVADAWTATSSVGVPSGYSFATAWAADRMVVWRGQDDGQGNVDKSGGRYDPATNTWSSINLGGPVDFDYKTVSTGNRMILWGGDGAVYDVIADTWTPMSTAGRPDRRYLDASVWTGDSMIVWGGGDNPGSNAPLIDGGRYIGAYDDDADGDGFTGCDGDCDDTRADVHPGAPELCDHLDNDCSGGVPANELDTDFDGFSACNGDCNNGNPAVHPGAPEICDGFDDDCNGSVLPGGEADGDGDGVRVCGGDCDDTRASVRPGAPELCDGLENNCSAGTWPAVPANERDDDGDHYVECVPWVGSVAGVTAGGDCDDTNATRYPRAPEINNGQDEQCPGDPGRGVLDEVSGFAGYFSSSDDTLFSWPAQSGATAYEIVRSGFASFAAGCVHATTPATSYTDPTLPTPGSSFYYLVRATSPFTGSWGQRSDLVERHPCPGCLTTGDWCDDQSVCTIGDACAGDVCTGSPVSCDDGNPCTNDSCNQVTGCAHTNNTLGCDDGSTCTSGDVCSGGVCTGTLPPVASHLVISQVQVSGDGANATADEFVELYNPTASPVSLSGWSLQSVTATFPFNALVQSLSGTVPAHGWFLIVGTGYNGSPAGNMTLTAFNMPSSGSSNLELVSSGVEITSCSVATIVDKVSIGGSGFCGEGTQPGIPAANNSVLRKPGGVCGNGTDTNVNSADFVIQIPSTPRNASSPPQP